MKLKFKSTKLHIVLAIVWVILMYPTIAFWSESVLWVGLMSCYALFIGHVSSYEAAASAGVDDETHKKLNIIADSLADLMEVAGLREDAAKLREVVGIEDVDD